MIFFHGTTEEYVKNIKKKGLFAATTDQWLLEVTNKNICCLSKRPISGEGGNPLFFARSKDQNGYIIAVYFPKNVLMEKKLVAIFDNKTLDDYVQYHFFPRQEFRQIGYQLFQKMKQHREQFRHFKNLDYKKRPATASDNIIYQPQDQRRYYKEVRNQNKRYMSSMLDLEFSDELTDLLQYIGLWENVWQFLQYHFAKITPETWTNFSEKNSKRNNKEFWQFFYQNFPMEIPEAKHKLWQDWFSATWLAQRKLSDILSQRNYSDFNKNCQILVESVEPEYILDCIHITTPSGLLPEFCFNEKSGIVQAVWKRIDRVLAKKKL